MGLEVQTSLQLARLLLLQQLVHGCSEVMILEAKQYHLASRLFLHTWLQSKAWSWQHKMSLGRLSSILYTCMYEGTYVWPLFVHSRIGPAGLGLCFSRKKLGPFKIRSKIVHA